MCGRKCDDGSCLDTVLLSGPSGRSDDNSSLSSDESESNPLADSYFEKASEVSEWAGKLHALETKRLEELGERDRLQDQGLPLQVSDEDFEKKFNAERDDLRKNYREALKQADDFRAHCINHDVPLAAGRWRGKRHATPLSLPRILEGQDQDGIRYAVQYGPSELITDPRLRTKFGVNSRLKMYGTLGEREGFDNSKCSMCLR